MRLQSHLARYQPVRNADTDELFAMRRAAWRKQGIVVLDVAAVGDDWTRQAVINLATELYGPRREVGHG